MRRLTGLAIGVSLVFLMAAVAGAAVFTETVNFDQTYWGHGTVEWGHNTPDDFAVPPDVVNSATIEIFASGLNNNNDEIVMNGQFQGYLQNQTWSWIWFPFWGEYEGDSFDVADILNTGWAEGDVLEVSLNYSEYSYFFGVPVPNRFNLNRSVFTLDYEAAAVPEPATLLLLGAGMLGLVGVSRKKFRK
ncbi:PEP-CTERM sorting domain-containing protein [Desulfatitalea alkaliphila]|uniref:PEP-CTERM sorting domain-containing protein n=1 Tax=Desulfatitalea alkaliphila TaxID=2929485 RepID=A0AA41R602_9BACT|nr:PEP-CTERM sorting domain-containing protein [Desulfatitalea alkaliphila]MCJ8502989.1 PEP-CTERM sorting domain-containing protein [Desulfatitalea alkaliphila]